MRAARGKKETGWQKHNKRSLSPLRCSRKEVGKRLRNDRTNVLPQKLLIRLQRRRDNAAVGTGDGRKFRLVRDLGAHSHRCWAVPKRQRNAPAFNEVKHVAQDCRREVRNGVGTVPILAP